MNADDYGVSMIYHLLLEGEIFSESNGGSVAKVIANMMRFDSSKVVTIRSARDTWTFGHNRILTPDFFSAYRNLKGRQFLPLSVHNFILRWVFRSFLSQLKRGDIVWCHNQPFIGSSLEAPIHAKGAALIYHGHSGYSNYAILRALNSFTADAYIFVSEALRDRWLRLVPTLRNVYAISNGTNEDIFYPNTGESKKQNEVPTIAYVGRLAPEKGAHLLVNAMRILENRGINAICDVFGSSFAGHGKSTRYIKQLKHSAPSNVRFCGYRVQKEIAEVFRRADMLCCPSIVNNPYSGVTLEALACGLPVISARVRGMSVAPYEGGVIHVEPDCPARLADELQRLIEDRDLRIKVGSDGLRLFREKFTWSATSSQYRSVIAGIWPGTEK
jgi:spore coat protein SA